MPRSKAARALVSLLFLGSGACGLVYEVVWTRYLVLFLGNTARANAVVLATFMGGLAIGYALFGRSADRLDGRARLAAYAALEAGIGVYGALFPWLVAATQQGFFAAARAIGPESPLVLPLGLAASSLCVLLPSIAMGGTLPLLVSWAADAEGDAEGDAEAGARGAGRDRPAGGRTGLSVSRLYAVNSAGAVVGGLLSGFVLIERLGQRATLFVAAGGNLAVAAAAIALVAAARRPDRERATPVDGSLEPPLGPGDGTSRVAPGLALAAGFAALVLEVVFIRLFGLVFGSATQSFSAVVCAYIAGIAIGAALARRLLARPALDGGSDPARVAGATDAALQHGRVARAIALAAAGCALFTLVAQPAFARLPWLIAKLRVYYGAEHAFARYTAARAFVAFVTMAGPTVLSGVLLPLCAELASLGRGAGGRARSGAAAATGRVFAANAVGSVLGAALAGTVLLPRLSMAGATVVAELVYVALAATAWDAAAVTPAARDRPRPALARLVPVVLALATVAPVVLVARGWDVRALDSGEFRRVSPPGDFRAWQEEQSHASLTFHEDGAASSVAVLTLPDGKRFLKVNGKTDASNWGDVLTAAASPVVGVLTAEQARTGLVIGLGSGVTATALWKLGLDVDVIEIEPAVLRAAALFTDVNDGVLDHVRTHLADARTWLALAGRRFDVIVNEPSNPWVAGVAALFTREFFELARDHLDDGGTFVQWFHLYDMDDATVRLILRTITSVFPDVSVWQFENDVALVARKRPTSRDLGRMAQRLRAPSAGPFLAKVGIYDLFSLLSLELLSESGVERLMIDEAEAGERVIHVDDLPTLEFHAPHAQFDRSYSFWLASHDERAQLAPGSRGRPSGDLLLGGLLAARAPSLNEMIDFTLLQSSQPWVKDDFRFRYFERVLSLCREPWTLGRMVMNLEKAHRYAESERTLAALETIEPASARTNFLRAQVRLRRLGKAAAVGDAVLAGLLRACGGSASDATSGPFVRGCRALAESLAIRID